MKGFIIIMLISVNSVPYLNIYGHLQNLSLSIFQDCPIITDISAIDL